MLILEAARYSYIESPIPGAPEEPMLVAQNLGARIASQVERVRGDRCAADIGANVVVSTIFDLPLTSNWLNWRRIADEIEARTALRPTTFVSAYECASWGYSIRYLSRVLPLPARVVLSIFDPNIFDLTYWRRNDNWGDSGFGLTTLMLRIEDRRDEAPVTVASARTPNAVAEFALALRKRMAQDDGAVLAPPFFPAKIFEVVERAVPAARRLTNMHDKYGHCFGSDPWIRLIEHALASPEAQHEGRIHCPASIGLSGYWAFADVRLDPQGRYELDLSRRDSQRGTPR